MMMRPLFNTRYRLYLAALLVCIGFVAATISTFALVRPTYTYAAAPKLSIQFTCAKAVDNKRGNICVHTQAKAALTISIKYCTGHYAVSKSLKGTQYADRRGNHTWTWKPETKCKGPATAYVKEQLGSQSLRVTDKFIVK